MARTGLYQSEVKKARDALIAQGRHPSVDAVRVALGNTGSKTTIHKYLKELDEQDGGADGRKASISEALHDFVARLAAQLHEEGNVRVVEVEAQSLEKGRAHAVALAALRSDIESLDGRLERAQAAADWESAAHAQTRANLQDETIVRHTAEQQVADLKERLTENDAHRLSIEEKHKHAREALEHYRQSVKEQREQDQRRHEQQIQQLQAELRQLQQSLVVKQDDITRLNQEGARLVADLSHAQATLYDQQAQGRQLVQQIATLQDAAQQALIRLAAKDAQTEALHDQAAAAASKAEAAFGLVRELELALATAHATLASQHEVASELRAHLASRVQKADEAPEPRIGS
ncbi:MAG: DNA-binding protein [Pseudomonadota bacterium]